MIITNVIEKLDAIILLKYKFIIVIYIKVIKFNIKTIIQIIFIIFILL